MAPEQLQRLEASQITLPGYGVTGRAEWLDIDWSHYLHSAMIDGRRVNYVEFGDPDKPTVLLVHGLAGCWQNWLANVVGLSQNFHVVAPDLPGFGGSQLPADAISIHGFADVLGGLLDHLEVEKAHAIGNSMGGMTSMRLAIDHPHRVEKLVLVSPAGFSTGNLHPALPKLTGVAGLVSTRIASNAKSMTTRPRLRARVLRGVVAFPEQLQPEIVYELLGGATDPAGFAGALSAILGDDMRDELAQIEAQTLLLWGRRDGVITWRDGIRLADAIPNSELIVVKNAAHVLMVEHPEWFDRTATDFLLTS